MFPHHCSSLSSSCSSPSACPFSHPCMFLYRVIMVNKEANVFCIPGKWDSLLLIKHFSKLLLHPLCFLFFPTLFHCSSSLDVIFLFLLMGLPTYNKQATTFSTYFTYFVVHWGSFPTINCIWHQHSE